MREVNVKKDELLGKLRANRATHRTIFEEALEGYRKEAVTVLEKALADAKAGRRIRASIHLQQPIDQTPEYDRTILTSRWQDISSAPKDGTRILVAWPNGAVQESYFSQLAQRWNENAPTPPTHWMPLPDAPLSPSPETPDE